MFGINSNVCIVFQLVESGKKEIQIADTAIFKTVKNRNVCISRKQELVLAHSIYIRIMTVRHTMKKKNTKQVGSQDFELVTNRSGVLLFCPNQTELVK